MLSLSDFMLLSIYGQKNVVTLPLLQQIRESITLVHGKRSSFGSESDLGFYYRENSVCWMNEWMHE